VGTGDEKAADIRRRGRIRSDFWFSTVAPASKKVAEKMHPARGVRDETPLSREHGNF
jgi:hypothetical protein